MYEKNSVDYLLELTEGRLFETFELSELSLLISNALPYFKNNDFSELMDILLYPDDKITYSHNAYVSTLTDCLEGLPLYMESAKKVNLSYTDSVDVIAETVILNPYSSIMRIEHELEGYTMVYNSFSNNNIDLNKDLNEFKELIHKSLDTGISTHALGCLNLTTNLGLSISQSNDMISKLIDADGSLSGYSIRSMYDALNSLKFSNIKPELLVKAFDILGGDRPYYQQSNYSQFSEAITFQIPGSGISIDDFLKYIINSKNLQLTDNSSLLPNESIKDPLNIDNYFIDIKSSNLDYAKLPYKSKISLKEGVNELSNLANRKDSIFNEVAEGVWIFAPESETWYSLGGSTNVSAERARTTFLEYDISLLSSNPIFFHTHPKNLEFIGYVSRDSGIEPKFNDMLKKYVAITPSSADYSAIEEFMKSSKNKINLESYIVHSRGLTKINASEDIDDIHKMSNLSRTIRDSAIKTFIPEDKIYSDNFESLSELLIYQNSIMPENFKLNLINIDDFNNSKLNSK